MGTLTELTSVIQGAQRHERAALERLVDLYSHQLYGFLHRFTGQREDAEDLVQEVFVRVVRTIGSYRDDGRFEGWLFRIATNLLRDRVRRMRRTPTTSSLDSSVETAGEQHGEASGGHEAARLRPGRALELAEDVDRLQLAMDRLSDAQREVILLRHYARMSFPDIAEMTGVPVGTALARAHRGLAKLREWMESPL